jgi:hypothetical protein
MKTLLIALLMIGTVQAGEVDIMLTQWSRIADEEKYQVGNWQGIQLNYKFNSGAYVFASHETAQIIPLWGIGDMSMTGVGFGLSHNITPKLSLFGQLGYYMVGHENEGRHDVDPSGAGAGEGIGYYFNDKYGFITNRYIKFDEYEINYENTFAGIFGVQFTQPITKNSNIGFALSYKSMKISEEFIVYKDSWNYLKTGWRWEQAITRNYSAIGFSAVYQYQF